MAKKHMYLFLLFFMLSSSLTAQSTDTTVYPLVVQFQSHCCGVPNDRPLHDYICDFKKRNKLKKITAWRISPMGKEGEYWLGFHLKEMTYTQASQFITEIKAVAEKLNDNGAAAVDENITVVAGDLPRGALIEKKTY